jgi:hypothetical protein
MISAKCTGYRYEPYRCIRDSYDLMPPDVPNLANVPLVQHQRGDIRFSLLFEFKCSFNFYTYRSSTARLIQPLE